MVDINRRIDLWKSKLLDLGKRNRLINYRDLKRSSLRIIKPGLIELWKSLVVDGIPLVFPYDYYYESTLFSNGNADDDDNDEFSENSQHQDNSRVTTNQSPKDQQKTLKSIRDKARIVIEEQGVNVLYLAFGFLKWYETDYSDQTLVSPLVLVPVSINLESITSPYVIELYDDDILLNPTLVHKLDNDFGIKFPEFEENFDIVEYLGRLKELVPNRRWTIEQSVGLSLFSFLKINMYNDLEKNREIIVKNPIVHAICGDSSTLDNTPLDYVNDFDHDTNTKPSDIFQVVDADASQQDAILLAKKGASFIIQGPPGTGKSQTITNIIAECLAAGKKVLFVSEKMAALDVVHKRLTAAGLQDFCLTLHSHKANKKEIMDQLRNSLHLSRIKAELSDKVNKELIYLKDSRDELNAYAKQVFERIPPLDYSIFEVNGQLSELTAHEDCVFPIYSPENTTSNQLLEYETLLNKLKDTIGKMSSSIKQNPWYGSIISYLSHELRHDINSVVTGLLPLITNFEKIYSDLSNILDLNISQSYSTISSVIEILKVAKLSPKVPSSWITTENISSLYAEVDKIQTLIQKLTAEVEDFNQTRIDLLLLNKGLIFEKAMDMTFEACNQYLYSLQNFKKENPRFVKWDNLESFKSADQALVIATEKAKRFQTILANLSKNYDSSIREIEFNDILKRYKTDYSTFLKIFKPQYRRDRKEILTHFRTIRKNVRDAELLVVLMELQEAEEIQNWFIGNEKAHIEIIPGVYLNEHTDYSFLQNDLKLFPLLNGAISSLETCITIHNQVMTMESELQSHYDFLYQGLTTQWSDVRNKLDWASSFRRLVEKHSLSDGFISNVCIDESTINICGSFLENIISKAKEFSNHFEWFTSLFTVEEKSVLDNLSFTDLLDRLNHCLNGFYFLEEWIDYINATKECERAGLSEFVQIIESKSIDKNRIVPIFKKRFFRLWLDAILPKYPAVQNFRRRKQEMTINEFARLDVKQFELAKVRIHQKLISGLPPMDRFSKGDDEMSILRRELGKQRRIMPIRKLFRMIPNLLLTLKPCLLMSPLSVSLFLESSSLIYDTVIFDEASQVRTENAIGAIFRGRQVIITGDTKQLPPTNFFSATTSNVDFNGEDEDDDAGESYDSILDEGVLLPQRMLQWHYRSKNENLITFSNAKFYHNELITFPSSNNNIEDQGVEYHFVDNGVYDRGGKNGNKHEASRVARLVLEHFDKYPNRSLGVITFGEIQQQAIDSAVRQLRISNPMYEPFFNEDKEEAFFIKSLENVQGDERDTIIFSIGYAKSPTGQMYMNFGPLNKIGGERRLNVAVTRAKYNLKLVGSILPSDIVVDRVTAEGPKLLRSYIDYAISGPSAIMREFTQTEYIEHDSPFEKAVFDFLDRKGYKVVTQVGCSGYRIDMAIKHPEISECYVLGIECDGASYHSARTARERDRLRQEILEQMGWRIYRIWSTDWIKDPITEGQRLINEVEAAISNHSIQPSSTKNSLPRTVQNEKDYLTLKERDTSDKLYGFSTFSDVNIYAFRDRQGNISISKLIQAIVENEFPVHLEVLCKKLAPLYGRTNASSFVRGQIVYEIIMHDSVAIVGDYVYTKPKKKIKIKLGNKRKIDHISNEELSEAMIIVARQFVGCTPETLIQEVSRLYGFARTGEKIDQAMRESLSWLINRSQVKVVENKVVVSDQAVHS